MNGDSILLVEDDKEIRQGVEIFLRSQGYQVFQAENGLEGLKLLEERPIDLAIVDVMMPVMDGITMTAKLREKYDFPVIFLSAKAEEVDKILGLNIGADDYVTKPFGVMELISRIKAVLRRSGPQAGSDIIEYKGIILDNQSRNVKVDGKDIAITFKEFELLKYLLKNKGTVVPREVLLEKIWGYHFEGESRTLDVHIGSLRHKLGEKGKCIETIRNVGYKI